MMMRLLKMFADDYDTAINDSISSFIYQKKNPDHEWKQKYHFKQAVIALLTSYDYTKSTLISIDSYMGFLLKKKWI